MTAAFLFSGAFICCFRKNASIQGKITAVSYNMYKTGVRIMCVPLHNSYSLGPRRFVHNGAYKGKAGMPQGFIHIIHRVINRLLCKLRS